MTREEEDMKVVELGGTGTTGYDGQQRQPCLDGKDEDEHKQQQQQQTAFETAKGVFEALISSRS